MSHGIEIYNSSGSLVYSSQYKTIRLHANGIYTIASGAGPWTVSFPAISQRPQVHIELNGYYGITPPIAPYIPPMLLKPCIGQFIMSGSMYTGFQLRVWSTIISQATYNDLKDFATDFSWYIPYEIFI